VLLCLQLYFAYFVRIHHAKSAIDLKASDVVRQPKVADMPRAPIKDGNPDSASRLRSSETAPDSIYNRNAANGDNVNIGIEWTGGDVRSFCDIIILTVYYVSVQYYIVLLYSAFCDFLLIINNLYGTLLVI